MKTKPDQDEEIGVTIFPVEGILIGTAATGVRYEGRPDLTIFKIVSDSSLCSFFTKNKFAAAPIELAKNNQSKRRPKYLIINSGNANAGTGTVGVESARRVCESVASEAGCLAEEVLPFSTGVIGEQLDYKSIVKKIPEVFSDLSADGWREAAKAIMTTDTYPKIRSKKISLNGENHIVTGICKGSGMIKPNMATMLAYVATDATLPQTILSSIGYEALEQSFNRITVDGETSTNDAFVLIATGDDKSNAISSKEDDRYQVLSDAVLEVCVDLAKDIVRDGEGATKLVSIKVKGARSKKDALKVAYSVAESSLVKTALFAEDPNWGRILSAVGASGISQIEISDVSIHIGDQPVAINGALDSNYNEELVSEIMGRREFDVSIDLDCGAVNATVWTCDLSYDYVRINSEYRT